MRASGLQLKSDALTTDAPTDKSSSHISSLREEIEYLREENRAKTLIIKQMTEIKTTRKNSTLARVLNIPKTKRTQAQMEKIRRRLTKEKKNRKRRKKIITMRLQVGTTTTKREIITASLKN